MSYEPLMSLSSPHFPWPRFIGLKHRKEVELTMDLMLEQWIVPRGTKVLVWQGKDFGYCLIPEGSLRLPSGRLACGIRKRLFSY